MPEALGLKKTIDEIDFSNKMQQIKEKAKNKEFSDESYEKMFIAGI